MYFTHSFLKDIGTIANIMEVQPILDFIDCLLGMDWVKDRLYIVGVGGSAGTGSHSVNDFRKICNIQTFTPFDNVSEMTARINDSGWEDAIVEWMKVFNPHAKDVLLVLSVGGGNLEKNVSTNLIKTIQFAREIGMKTACIVGKNDGYAAKNCDFVMHVPIPNMSRITPYAEAMQSVILHLIVSHPKLKQNLTKWEEVQK